MTVTMRDARPETTDAHGATMVELAIVLPIFLLILLLSFDLLWVSYQLVTTQFVATRVLRQAIVGPRAALRLSDSRSVD